MGYHHPVTIFSSSTDRPLRPQAVSGSTPTACRRTPHVASAETAILHPRHPVRARAAAWSSGWPGRRPENSRARPSASPRAMPNRGSASGSIASGRSRSTAPTKPMSKSFNGRLPNGSSFPQVLRFSTTEQAPSRAEFAGRRRQIGAPAPPPVVEGAEMSLRVHESMINNLALDALCGPHRP